MHMIIKNFMDLATNHDKRVTLDVLNAGFCAAMPDSALKNLYEKTGWCF